MAFSRLRVFPFQILLNQSKLYCPQIKINDSVRCFATLRRRELPPQPYYENVGVKTDPTLITVPLRLRKRLYKKVEKDSTKYAVRQRQIRESREGSKSITVISAKRPELNHRKGQTYGRSDEIPLISKGWKHRKSHGDFFTVHPLSAEDAFYDLDGKDTFDSLGVSSSVVQVLKEQKIETPTLIQATAIPEILRGKNNLVASETGCGKTLAYLLPVFEQILASKSSPRPKRRGQPNQPFALVILPTRELAEQVHGVANSLGYPLGIRTRLLQGGNVNSKLNSPSTKEVDVLVTTISIVSTLSIMDVYDMSRVHHVVLDEADTLLDDSFSDEVLRFLRRFNFNQQGENYVQATLVSATMPRGVDVTLADILPQESLNSITTPGLHRIVKSVPQTFKRVRKMDKPKILLDIINKAISGLNAPSPRSAQPTIVFTNKSETCHWLGNYLQINAIDCVAVHGKIKPGERRGLLNQYQNGDVDVMVCTDLGSRGIDTVRTKQVINYEFPNFLADYVHRCGRVGRVGSDAGGSILNLISGANEVEIVQQIETSVRKDESLQKVNANIKRILNARYGMYKTIDPLGPNDQ